MTTCDPTQPMLPFAGGIPYQRQSKTSRDAGRRARSLLGARQKQMIDFFRERKEQGSADFETQEELKISGDSQRPVRISLVKLGVVVDGGRTRPTPSGHQATVWVLLEFSTRAED